MEWNESIHRIWSTRWNVYSPWDMIEKLCKSKLWTEPIHFRQWNFNEFRTCFRFHKITRWQRFVSMAERRCGMALPTVCLFGWKCVLDFEATFCHNHSCDFYSSNGSHWTVWHVQWNQIIDSHFWFPIPFIKSCRSACFENDFRFI